MTLEARKDLRNLAIIAHVDHGKTTLVDGLFRFTGAFGSRDFEERAMDSGDLERERGITISAKSTSVEWEGLRIQLVDTPGHADFGGEVERTLGMVDAALLLVDAVEGVMPQTRFVLRKALAHGLRPILVVNKIDRPEQRADQVVDEVFDLLVELGAADDQLDFPVVYASAKQEAATLDLAEPLSDLRPLLEVIREHAPPPLVDREAPLQFQAVTLGWDDFVGRLVIGRVERGVLERNATVVRIPAEGSGDSFRVRKLFGVRGLSRTEQDRAEAGDIAILAGIDSIEIGDTLCDPGELVALPRIALDPPTLRVRFGVNDSAFAGREGQFVTSRQLWERLEREALGNPAILVEETATRDTFEVAGRGELQISVLVETLRREGFEFGVSRPEIILREVEGRSCEPVEEVWIDVPEKVAGSVMEKLGGRRGRMVSMEHEGDRMTLQYVVPSRCLFGYRSEVLSDTRGEGGLHRSVQGYEPYVGDIDGRGVGAIVATEEGRATAHALASIQERATMFIEPGAQVYEGQVVGEARRPGDIQVNVCRTKKLTNIRAAGRDDSPQVSPPRRVTIESALEWIEDDELLEVTPENLRLRKRILSGSFRKR
ncbi:MAG: translational GTPase TypA [Myxococcota bacterium]|nr:translational GTPase TypA [Myxococcota bacterium]